MAAPAAGRRRRVGGGGRGGPWADAWRRFLANRMAAAGLVVSASLSTLALMAPMLAELGLIAGPYELDLDRINAGPSLRSPLGTDYLGRDLFSRVLAGTGISLSIALGAQVLSLGIGGTVGLLAGYLGGRIDNLLMRFTDAVFALPELLFVLVIAAVLGPGRWNIMLAIGIVSWAFLARLVRGEALAIREQQYVEAAKAAGSGRRRTILRHVVPNALGPVIVTLTFGVPTAIFAEAFLSFIGVGVRPPTPSLGVMVNEGYQAIFAHPHQVLFPAVAIAVITMSFTFIGDGLRDALDPQSGRHRLG